MKSALFLLFFGIVAVTAQRRLALPDPRSCANRKIIIKSKIIINIKRLSTLYTKIINNKFTLKIFHTTQSVINHCI